jgi:hypothetical protein
MIQDLPTNITNGQLSGNVKYIEHEDGTWSFRLTIYVSEEPTILSRATGTSLLETARKSKFYMRLIHRAAREASVFLKRNASGGLFSLQTWHASGPHTTRMSPTPEMTTAGRCSAEGHIDPDVDLFAAKIDIIQRPFSIV